MFPAQTLAGIACRGDNIFPAALRFSGVARGLPQGRPLQCMQLPGVVRGFEKGVGGRGLAMNGGQLTAEFVPQDRVLRLLRGHRKKGAENRPESLA